MRTGPARGSSMPTTMLRASVCGSDTAPATSLSGPQGTPAASSDASQWAVLCVFSVRSSSAFSASTLSMRFGLLEKRSSAGQVFAPQRLAEFAEQRLVAGCHDDVPVCAFVTLEGSDGRMPRAGGGRAFAGGEITRDGVFEDRQLAVEHGDVDEASAPGARAFVQRGANADSGEQPGGDVADGRPHPRRRRAFVAGEAHDAAHALHHHVVGGGGATAAPSVRSPNTRRRRVRG